MRCHAIRRYASHWQLASWEMLRPPSQVLSMLQGCTGRISSTARLGRVGRGPARCATLFVSFLRCIFERAARCRLRHRVFPPVCSGILHRRERRQRDGNHSAHDRAGPRPRRRAWASRLQYPPEHLCSDRGGPCSSSGDDRASPSASRLFQLRGRGGRRCRSVPQNPRVFPPIRLTARIALRRHCWRFVCAQAPKFCPNDPANSFSLGAGRVAPRSC